MNVLYNGHLSREENEFPGTRFRDGISLYEVFRILNGHVLFLEDNIARLGNSICKSGWTGIAMPAGIAGRLERLIRENGIVEGNIKYVLHAAGHGVDEYIYQIPHDYPTEKNYQDGVDVISLHASRDNAEVKYLHAGLRERTDQIIRAQGVYEVLLVDKHEYFTEGSRSNVFFIREDTLYTAPLPHVLPGTTRKRVIEICREEGIPVVEQRVALADARHVQAAFLTGTSPLVLPIRRMDEVRWNPRNPLLRRVMTRYFSLLSR
jgi:branched-chain amino acid aminotransferase